MASYEDLDPNRALEVLFDSLSGDIKYRAQFYPREGDNVELYIEINGECFQISAKHHPHGWE